jgi:hypothetical protein
LEHGVLITTLDSNGKKSQLAKAKPIKAMIELVPLAYRSSPIGLAHTRDDFPLRLYPTSTTFTTIAVAGSKLLRHGATAMTMFSPVGVMEIS